VLGGRVIALGRGRRYGPDQLGHDKARRIARCNIGELLSARAMVTAGFANDEVNQYHF